MIARIHKFQGQSRKIAEARAREQIVERRCDLPVEGHADVRLRSALHFPDAEACRSMRRRRKCKELRHQINAILPRKAVDSPCASELSSLTSSSFEATPVVRGRMGKSEEDGRLEITSSCQHSYERSGRLCSFSQNLCSVCWYPRTAMQSSRSALMSEFGISEIDNE